MCSYMQAEQIWGFIFYNIKKKFKERSLEMVEL
jgi:hypothetical protein